MIRFPEVTDPQPIRPAATAAHSRTAVVFFMNKDSIDIKEAAVFLAAYVAAFCTIRIGFIKIEKKRTEKLEKEYDDD